MDNDTKGPRPARVRLVSTSENVDQTPDGIMSSIAEFYSRNLANEVVEGMSEKARNGGANVKAPLGRRNVRARDAQGHEIRTVELDPERAPLMRLAFTEYSTGNWTVCALAKHLTGLTTSPTPNKPATTVLHGALAKPAASPLLQGRRHRAWSTPDRIRTCDLLLRRQTLYPLSYWGSSDNCSSFGALRSPGVRVACGSGPCHVIEVPSEYASAACGFGSSTRRERVPADRQGTGGPAAGHGHRPNTDRMPNRVG